MFNQNEVAFTLPQIGIDNRSPMPYNQNRPKDCVVPMVNRKQLCVFITPGYLLLPVGDSLFTSSGGYPDMLKLQILLTIVLILPL